MKFGGRINGFLFVAGLMVAWETLSRAGAISPLFFPPVSAILASFAGSVLSGEIPYQVAVSLRRGAAGYFLAAAVFIPLGLLMGLYRALYRALEIVIEILRPIPPPAVVPAAMLFFGIGDAMKVFVIFFSSAWPILLNTIDGVRNIDAPLLHTARTFGVAGGRALLKVVLPAASPQIMTGLRVSLAIALILVVISEMVGSTDGIGYFILDSQRRFQVVQMYSGMLTLALLGYGLNQLFLFLHRRLLAWHWGWSQRR